MTLLVPDLFTGQFHWPAIGRNKSDWLVCWRNKTLIASFTAHVCLNIALGRGNKGLVNSVYHKKYDIRDI